MAFEVQFSRSAGTFSRASSVLVDQPAGNLAASYPCRREVGPAVLRGCTTTRSSIGIGRPRAGVGLLSGSHHAAVRKNRKNHPNEPAVARNPQPFAAGAWARRRTRTGSSRPRRTIPARWTALRSGGRCRGGSRPGTAHAAQHRVRADEADLMCSACGGHALAERPRRSGRKGCPGPCSCRAPGGRPGGISGL